MKNSFLLLLTLFLSQYIYIDPVFQSIYYILKTAVKIDIYILTLFLSQYIIRTCIVAEGAERPSAAICLLTEKQGQYIYID